jgi:UPF0755 protein
MSLNSKIILFCLIVLAVVSFGSYKYYRHLHPKYLPPPPRPEVTITIIPGWTLRDVAADWIKKGLIKTPEDLYQYTGTPAADYRTRAVSEPVPRLFATDTAFAGLFDGKPNTISYEGYLWPDTYRVYADASIPEILRKIFLEMDSKITPEIRAEIKRQDKSLFEILTMASVVEKEVQGEKDRAIVSDILWSRIARGMRLQVDSSVHYVTGKTGNVFTSDEDRHSSSPWNTYEHVGLPLGPIGNPALDAIRSALYPEKNDYLYFLTGNDGKNYFAKTLDEHNQNVYRYLR